MRKLHIIALSLVFAFATAETTPLLAQHRGYTPQNNRGYRPGTDCDDDDDDDDDDDKKYKKGRKWRIDRDDDDWDDDDDRRKHKGHYRPGKHKGHYKPGNPHFRPYHSGHFCPPPRRPYRPDYRPVTRPHIPDGYAYLPGAPTIDRILGMVFGLAYKASLDHLYDNGYVVDGYNGNRVFLRDVDESGYRWDDGILSYDGCGCFNSAQFSISQNVNDTQRFNKLYRKLTKRYGKPIEKRNGYNNRECIWFGGRGEGFVTLQYSHSPFGGRYRYVTTLTYSR